MRRITALPCREFSKSYSRQKKKGRFPPGRDNEAREEIDNEEEGSGEQKKGGWESRGRRPFISTERRACGPAQNGLLPTMVSRE